MPNTNKPKANKDLKSIKTITFLLLLILVGSLLNGCASRPSRSDFYMDNPNGIRKFTQTIEQWLVTNNDSLSNSDKVFGYYELFEEYSKLGECDKAVAALNDYVHYFSMATNEEPNTKYIYDLHSIELHPSYTRYMIMGQNENYQAKCLHNNIALLTPESALFIYQKLYLKSLEEETFAISYKHFMPQLLNELHYRYSSFHSDKELIQQLESADAIRDSFSKDNGPLQQYDARTSRNLEIGEANNERLIGITNALEKKRIYFLTATLNDGRKESGIDAKRAEGNRKLLIEMQMEKERAINQSDGPSLTSTLLNAGIAAANYANNPAAMRESLKGSAIDYVAGPDNAALASVAKGIASGNKAATQQALSNATIDYVAGDSQEMAAAAKQMLSQYQNGNRTSVTKLSGDCQRQINAIKPPPVANDGAACPAFQAQAKFYAQVADVASRCATPAEAADARRAANEAAQAARQFCGDTSSYPARQSYTPPSTPRPAKPATREVETECSPDLIGSKCPRR